MEPEEKEAIRARTDIVELISSYTALRRQGSRFKGLCPFHQEKTPSFTVDPEMGRWHCFGACSTGGDVFTFLERAENLTFIEAAQRLAERAGITLTPRGGNREDAQRAQSEKDRLFAANALALQFFRQCFARDRMAREYVERRGLAHETLETFQVGYAPDDWSQLSEFLLRRKIHGDDAVKAGLITASKRGDGTFTDRFRGRLIFPILDVQERVVGFGGRIIADTPGAPKYLNSPETPVFSKSRVLYALNRARRPIADRETVVVVEGYMDAVAAHQAGIGFVVATLGTSLTEEHVRLLRRYAKNVVLSFDADEAGVRAALRAGELFAASSSGDNSGDLTLRVLSLPPGEDPDSLLSKGDVAAFHKAISGALTVPEFRLEALIKSADTETDTGKIALLREAVPVIAAVPSLIEQDVLIRRMALYHPSYGTSSMRAEESVRAEVSRAGGGRRGDDFGQPNTGPSPQQRGTYGPRRPSNGHNGSSSGQGYRRWNEPQRPFVMPDTGPTPQPPPAAQMAERTLLRALLSDEWIPVLRESLSKSGEAPDFADPRAARLAAVLWPLVSGKMAPAEAVAQLVDPEIADFADAVRMSDMDAPLGAAAIEDAVRQLARYRLMRKREEIRALLTGPSEGNTGNKDEMLRQLSDIERTLKSTGDDADPIGGTK